MLEDGSPLIHQREWIHFNKYSKCETCKHGHRYTRQCIVMQTHVLLNTASWLLVPVQKVLNASFVCHSYIKENVFLNSEDNNKYVQLINIEKDNSKVYFQTSYECEPGFLLFKHACLAIYYYKNDDTIPANVSVLLLESTNTGSTIYFPDPKSSSIAHIYKYLWLLMQMNICFNIIQNFDYTYQDMAYWNNLYASSYYLTTLAIQKSNLLLSQLGNKDQERFRYLNICSGQWLMVMKNSTKLNITHLFQHRLVYLCPEGFYITSSSICDGTQDCKGEQADEGDCLHICSVTKMYETQNTCAMCMTPFCMCNFGYFQCFSGGCINSYKVCNFFIDCKDASDETFCLHPVCATGIHFTCASGQCVSITKRCDLYIDCLDKSDEINCTSRECQGFSCNDGTCIHAYKQNNLVVDCSDEEDEAEYFELLHNPAKWMTLPHNCSKFQVPCFPGHSMCIHLDKACIYDTEIDGTIMHCGNGAHLQNCENFDCPQQGMYKCLRSYCIHVYKVCNMEIDCPLGDDELNCPMLGCPSGFFRCKYIDKCILASRVCDGVVDCVPFGDDENVCDYIKCPQGCNCSQHALHCEGKYISSVAHNTKYIESLCEIKLHETSIFRIRHLLFLSRNLRSVSFQKNKISSFLDLKDITQSYYIYSIDLSFNELTDVSTYITSALKNLKYLFLGSNFLVYFDSSIICPFSSGLHYVNLSQNLITYTNDVSFNQNCKVQVLDISNNPISELFFMANTFVNFLYVTDLTLCCWTQNSGKCFVALQA